MQYILPVLIGVIVGGVIAWFVAYSLSARRSQSKLEQAEQRADAAESKSSSFEGTANELRRQNEKAAADFESIRSQLANERSAKDIAVTELKETLKRLDEEKKLLEEARSKLTDVFKAAAGDTLNASTSEFLKLAKETFEKVMVEAKGDLGKNQEAMNGMVKPLSDSLQKFEEHLKSVEKDRQESYGKLSEQVKGLLVSEDKLKKETDNLVKALRRPEVRGRWGEMTLRRVVELAGMSEHCDFCEQVSTNTEEGRLRPDLIIKLPNERDIIVDSKVPLDAYLDANSAENEETRNSAMTRHAKQIRDHMVGLAKKEYWSTANSPEFVVMFIPGDSFFGAAVDVDPTLIEDALEKHVVIATPATLIALVRAVAYGWRQEQITKHAKEISELGKQLYERMRTLTEYISDIGTGLEKANGAYNKAANSLESRVLPAARKFKDLGTTTGEEIPFIQNIQGTPRQITSPELTKPETE